MAQAPSPAWDLDSSTWCCNTVLSREYRRTPTITAAITGFRNSPFGSHEFRAGLEREHAPVELCGKVPPDTLRDMLRRAALVVVPTAGNETFGFAALEGMAAGVPVIATRAGALPELVGVYVHTPAKAGRDAGELCGLDPVGVVATNSVDEIVAIAPDCVLYMPRACDFDQVCRLLASSTWSRLLFGVRPSAASPMFDRQSVAGPSSS